MKFHRKPTVNPTISTHRHSTVRAASSSGDSLPVAIARMSGNWCARAVGGFSLHAFIFRPFQLVAQRVIRLYLSI